ncbi:MAG TPA: alpha/beta hydrolase [Microthrixaceae bacterium]|nr:alpha/beta hydrolase [Microthrixaceae bacterium]
MRFPRRSTLRSLWWAASAANGRWPARLNRYLSIPSFFWGWITTEAAGPLFFVNLWGGFRAWRRGETKDLEGKAAMAARVVAGAALVGFAVEGRRTDDEFEAALAPFLSTDDLAARPRSSRAGAFVPFLFGGYGRRKRVRNITFSPEGHHRLRLDVYQPLEPGTKRPAIVQIHGGGWVIGDKSQQGLPLLNHLARHGWVGFNVDYQKSPRAKAPAHLIDCKLAIAWVRAHAHEYGADPDFIVVTGGSAGGHLCALVALTANDPAFQPGFEDADTSVQAAVPMYGVYDLADVDGHMVTGFRDLFIEPVVMGARFRDGADAFESYSPYYRVRPEAPPMMIVHGSKDSLVPIESARPFAARMAETSESAVVYVELQGAQHGFDVFPSPRTVRTVEYIERFLDGVRRGVIK